MNGKATSANYADSAGTANSVAWANVTGKPAIPATPNIYVTSSWQSGPNWWRQWSNGWIEQGGEVIPSALDFTVSLHKAFANTSYRPIVGSIMSVTTGQYSANAYAKLLGITTSSFGARASAVSPSGISWYACGY